jgi:hypothetical protein
MYIKPFIFLVVLMGGCVGGSIKSKKMPAMPEISDLKINKSDSSNELQNYWHNNKENVNVDIDKDKNIQNVMKTIGL